MTVSIKKYFSKDLLFTKASTILAKIFQRADVKSTVIERSYREDQK
jgi:hypothetical protein